MKAVKKTKVAKKPLIDSWPDEVINVYEAPPEQEGFRWIAMYGIGRNFPIWFGDDTKEAVIERAAIFRNEKLAEAAAIKNRLTSNIKKAQQAKRGPRGKKTLAPIPEDKFSPMPVSNLKFPPGRRPSFKEV